MRSRFIFIVVLAIAGCGGSPKGPVTRRPVQAPPPARPARFADVEPVPTSGELPEPALMVLGPYQDSERLGGMTPGFVWWVSDNAKLVALYRFDGSPRFARDGRPLTSEPVLTLVNRQTRAIVTYDELVAADPRGRMVIMRKGSRLFQVMANTGRRENMNDRHADPTPDDNACQPPRQASFDVLGQRLSWIRPNPFRVVVQELDDGSEWDVTAQAPLLWRAQPDALRGWAFMRLVVDDTDGDGRIRFPTEDTSCACLWCQRFAERTTFRGWEGDTFLSVLAGPDGRLARVEGRAIALGPEAYALTQWREVRRLDGSEFPLPTGCEAVHLVHGVENAVLDCGSESRLLLPTPAARLVYARSLAAADAQASGRRSRRRRRRRPDPPPPPVAPRLTEPVQPLPVSLPFVNERGAHWVAVLAGEGARRRLARLRMEDGRLELGPEASEIGTPHHTGWVLALSAHAVFALHLGDGRLRRFSFNREVSEIEGLSISTADGHWLVFHPEEGIAYETEHRPRWVTSDGCIVAPTSVEGALERGPWRVRCPAPPL